MFFGYLFSDVGVFSFSFLMMGFCVFSCFACSGVPLHPVRDRPLEQFRRLYEDEGQYVYREGTIDPSVPWITGVSSLHKVLEGSLREPIQSYTSSFSSFQVPLNDIGLGNVL